MYPVPAEERQVLQDLMNDANRDREKSFTLVRAVRVEHSDLWASYQKKVAKIRRRRGECRFAGRGPPLTVEALAVAENSDRISQSLDLGACEVYLWHGTKPQVALQIVEKGFQVDHHSSIGKRFGAGGYFTEDPAKADVYAACGEGLYKDCYAMLLCRVVLGRQFVTHEFRCESASDEARRWKGHDSMLAEPRGASYREFVAFGNDQVYPEYALVYERRPPQLPKEKSNVEQYWADAGAGAMAGDFPSYWLHAKAGGFFHETCPDDRHMMPIVQALADDTWTRAHTCDRRGRGGAWGAAADPESDVPQGLRVLKVLRVENSELWSEYRRAQEEIRRARGDCACLEALDLRALRELPPRERRRLALDVNEAYLWHGSSPREAMSVSERGFPAKLCGEVHGMFGDGAYFVDSAAHADEYSEDDREGYYMGDYAMLLCRVTLGKVQALEHADPAAHGRVGPGGDFDSTAGRREAAGGPVRELVVTRRVQIYPEYVFLYERVYKTPRVR